MSKKPVLRTCAICHKKIEKKDLIRIVRSPEGEVTIDTSGKKQGRGAYLCSSKACIENAKKSKRIDRALDVEINEEIYNEALKYVTTES